MLQKNIFIQLIICFISLVVNNIWCYDSNSAYNYAQKYFDKVVSDGYFWEKSDFPSYLGAGAPVPDGGYDCAHFVSCVIGNEVNEKGGGLDIPSRTITYGEPGANNLGDLLISYNYGIEVFSIDELQKGDVILYDWDGNGWNEHSAIYLGDFKVAAHSRSIWNAQWSLGGAISYRFIHIISENYSKGDINGDRAIDISDVILCLRMAIELDEKNTSLSDMNNDGEVDMSDVILLLRIAIGLT